MTLPYDTSRLRQAWSRLADRSDACEEGLSGQIWEAVRGELEPGETRRLVAHIATCPACAEAWRLARELTAPTAPAPGASATDSHQMGGAPALTFPRRPRAGRWLAVAAAALMVTVSGRLVLRQPADGDAERGAQPGIETLVPDGATLPRDACLLEWQPGPPGSQYEVLVTTPDLSVVAESPRLEEPRYQVPAADLAHLADGAELLWRVEMVLPEGRYVTSPAFRLRIR